MKIKFRAVAKRRCVRLVLKENEFFYSVILMDIQMPVMNRYEATRRIRGLSDPELAQIPIVAMTANAFDEDRKRCLEAGMNGHVGKPIDVNVLFRTLSGTI